MHASKGSCSIFTGAMSATIARYATRIKILEDATFENLTFQFDGGEAQQASPEVVTYLAAASIELEEVKSFKLDTGSIMVWFGHAKGTA